MIEFIAAERVLPLRSEFLRNGLRPPEQCRFAEDDLEGAFHLGYIIDNQPVCVCSFSPNNLEPHGSNGFQIRGMATVPQHRKKGYGNLVVNFGVLYLKGRGLKYVWCNARRNAYGFYSGLGFEFISEEFDIEGVGFHRKMYLKIS